MEVKAKVKHIRISPKKTRLVADLIRGMDVVAAQHQLEFLNKKSARPVLKLLNSAVANAENNFSFKKDNLYIKSITVDEGSVLKRWQPRAFGRATPIRKRSSHIIITLVEKVETKIIKKKALNLAKPEILETKPAEKIDKKGMPVEAEKMKREEEDKERNEDIFDATRKGKHRAKQHLDKTVLKGAKGKIKRLFRRKSA